MSDLAFCNQCDRQRIGLCYLMKIWKSVWIYMPGTNLCLLVRDDDYTHQDEFFTDL